MSQRRPLSHLRSWTAVGVHALTVIGLLALACVPVWAQAGSLDSTFDPGSGADSYVIALAFQPDGKVVIGGEFVTVNGVSRKRVARLNADGSLDTTFDPRGGANLAVHSVALQGDGKVVIAGEFTTVDGLTRNRIARLHADGTLDTTFDPGAGPGGVVFTAVVQSDGKVVIGGMFRTIGGVSRDRIARLTSTGTLDTSFDPGTGADYHVITVAVQPDGKILLAGLFTAINGTSRGRVARLNAGGSVDTGFSVSADESVSSLAMQSDGKVMIGGDFTGVNGVSRARVARLNADGSTDMTFNPGTGANAAVQAMAIRPDGKIVLGGRFQYVSGVSANHMARLNADGSVDARFNVGTGPAGDVLTIAIQPDGKILIGGLFAQVSGVARKHIARLNGDTSSGTLDANFNSRPGPNGSVHPIALQPDGKLVIGGGFTAVGSVTRNYIARLHPDGSLDSTFDPGSNGGVSAIAVQPDGKVLVGGQFTSIGGMSRNRIARLTSSGAVDTTFNPGTGADADVHALTLHANRMVLLGGWFYSLGGLARYNIGRLYANGKPDTTFKGGREFLYGLVQAIAVQPNGKIVIGGLFSSVAGVSRRYIARLNSDGSLDTTFRPGAGANEVVNAVAVQRDGKIVVTGNFTSINGVARNRVARLHPDGSVDTSFDTGVGPAGPIYGGSEYAFVYAVAIDGNDKLVIGGWFTSVNGISRNRVARLNSDGTLDSTFDPGTGANAIVRSVRIQPDGMVVIGGDFTSFNGVNRDRIARLRP